jgi:predicted double-glycine peptidase
LLLETWSSGRSRPGRARVSAVRCAVLAAAIASLGVSVDGSGARAEDRTRPAVRSLLEFRRDKVVVQDFDLSCGAAALATLLTYQHDDPVSEREIARGLIQREEYLENPELVRRRQGFSLLDLKRFVERRGYRGVGLGQLGMDSLIERAPAIVPVNLVGYSHFVVFRGMLDGNVLLADPAYGNRTMPRERFERAWIEDAKLGRMAFVVARRDGRALQNRLEPQPHDFTLLR